MSRKKVAHLLIIAISTILIGWPLTKTKENKIANYLNSSNKQTIKQINTSGGYNNTERIVGLTYNQVLNSRIIDSEKNNYYKSLYNNQIIKWQGKISKEYTQITGIKFCVIDKEHQDVDIKKPCDLFWTLSEPTKDADDINTNPSWDGNWVDYILNYYKVPFNKNSDFYNDIYTITGQINGIDCAFADRCAPDIETISITK